MATDTAASLHQGFQQAMIALTGSRIAGDGSIWWVVPVVLFIGSIGSRLLVDMWSSRLASIAIIVAATAYLTALVAFFHAVSLQSEVSQLLLVQGAALGGHLLLAVSMGLHARYVLLDAEGALPKRPLKKRSERKKAGKKAGKAATGDAAEKVPAASGTSDAPASDDDNSDSSDEKADDENSGDTWVAVDPPHGGSQPVLKRVAPGETLPVPSLSQKIVIPTENSSSDPGADDSKLSKSDRKALKKKLIDERLQRARKAANW